MSLTESTLSSASRSLANHNDNLATETGMAESTDGNSPSYTEQPIEADSTSDYDTDSVGSDLTSIASSIFEYQYENGRRYHAYRAGRYVLPNDEKEQDRLDLMHHVFRLSLCGSLCLTQLDNPLKVLDVGTGTGIWAIQFADEFPSAEVIGTDVSQMSLYTDILLTSCR